MPDVLTVNLGERSYPITFGLDLGAQIRATAEALGSAGRKIAVVTDSTVRGLQGPLLDSAFGGAPAWVAAPGEESKSLAELGRVLDFLAELRLVRGGRSTPGKSSCVSLRRSYFLRIRII